MGQGGGGRGGHRRIPSEKSTFAVSGIPGRRHIRNARVRPRYIAFFVLSAGGRADGGERIKKPAKPVGNRYGIHVFGRMLTTARAVTATRRG